MVISSSKKMGMSMSMGMSTLYIVPGKTNIYT